MIISKLTSRVIAPLVSLLCTYTAVSAPENFILHYPVQKNSINLGEITKAKLEHYLHTKFKLVGKTSSLTTKPTGYHVVRYHDCEGFLTYETYIDFAVQNGNYFDIAFSYPDSTSQKISIEVDKSKGRKKTKVENQQLINHLRDISKKDSSSKKVFEKIKSIDYVSFFYSETIQENSPRVVAYHSPSLPSGLILTSEDKVVYYTDGGDFSENVQKLLTLYLNGFRFLYIKPDSSRNTISYPFIKLNHANQNPNSDFQLRKYKGNYGARGC